MMIHLNEIMLCETNMQLVMQFYTLGITTQHYIEGLLKQKRENLVYILKLLCYNNLSMYLFKCYLPSFNNYIKRGYVIYNSS